LVEEPLLHTPETANVHWLGEERYQTFVSEHQLVESYILHLYGPRNCKARRMSFGLKDPIAACM